MERNRINDILLETVEEFLNEELSINNDLDTAVDGTVKDLISKYKNNDIIDMRKVPIMCDGIIYPITLKSFLCNVHISNLGNINCFINIYEIEDEELGDKIYTELELNNHFNKHNKSVEITIWAIDGKINRQWLKGLMCHECEHAFQFIISGKNTEVQNAYIKAKNIVSGKDKYHNSKEFESVAWLIYFYNKSEMDANINSLYGEMMENDGITLDKTNFNVSRLDAENNLRYVLSVIGGDEIEDAIAYFGMNSKRFIKNILGQRKYLNIKIRKVVQHVMNKRQAVKENVRPITNRIKYKPIGEYK